MIVMRLGKTIRELSHGMIVHIDERRDALGGAARFGMRLLHAVTMSASPRPERAWLAEVSKKFALKDTAPVHFAANDGSGAKQ